ncbi:ABC transporter ATP-binding protein [Paenibacillus humicola]|uniref:ABC transporter ATP-binding protein n=1 Tax=Paenibacillus humicola TaxID=3110540 RepID=UPI00237BB544|nr:ABC transporter ATP-binding protein [Paenibacillus humicola]
MGVLEAKGLGLSYGDAFIFEDLDLAIPKEKITVFIGSNGCGKSTLLRSMARLLKPQRGSVVLDGGDIAGMSTKEVARKLSILPQGPTVPEGFTVLQLVKQGRYPYQSWLKMWSREDEAAVMSALAATGMSDFAERTVDSLSGGQRQRAWIAMTLAQDTPVILLDEPTTYLDLTHQIEVLDLLYELNEREKRTIVMVLHDINLACRYADHIVAIRCGKIEGQGRPEAIVDESLIDQVFQLKCKIMPDPIYGTPMCIPHGKSSPRRAAAAGTGSATELAMEPETEHAPKPATEHAPKTEPATEHAPKPADKPLEAVAAK